MTDRSEAAALREGRRNYYNFLSRLYEKELSASFLEQMEAMEWDTDGEQEEMNAGCGLLKAWLAESDRSIREDELAADYAKIFLAAGEAKGKAAFPYESVYTSKEKLIMQEAWEQVKAAYEAKGLVLAEGNADIKEDHISAELKFMGWLCEHGSASEQRDFLEKHLLNWAEDFVKDMEQYARTDFYKAIGKLTIGFLKYDKELLKSVPAVPAKEDTVSYEVSPKDMDAVLDSLKKHYRIYAPKSMKKRGSTKDVVRYQEISSVSEIAYDVPSDFSAKEVYYPIMQTMFYFTEDSCMESKVSEDKGILLFLRPCDINAMRRLDNIFLKNGGNEDLYYKRLREKVKVVLLECSGSFEHCFCVSMKSNRTEDYGMAVRMGRDKILVQVKDAEWNGYFAGRSRCEFTPEFIRENKKKVTVPEITDRDTLRAASSLAYWEKFDGNCIGCGGCNTVCPTCSCFDTIDVIYNESSREGERRRVWSSCMLDTFTMTAGGGRARKTAGANMRFKVLHKIYDYRKRFQEENMCVGCGRCNARCPKNISFSDTLNEFAQELEKLSMEGGIGHE